MTLDPDARGCLTVRAYVRPSLLADGTIRALEALETTGTVDEVAVTTWPRAVPLAADPVVPEAVEVFERFQEWAAANGASIQPPFTVQTWASEITGETKRLLRLPVTCLGIERDGEIATVIPHSDGDTHYSVRDAFVALDVSEGDVGARDAGAGFTGMDGKQRGHGSNVDAGYPLRHD